MRDVSTSLDMTNTEPDSDKRLLLWDIDSTLITTGGAGDQALKQVVEMRFGVRDAFDDIEIAGCTDAAIATSILRTPHDGAASMLSPGTYGHGGAWGTQAWIDPVKGVAYSLMIQRSGLPNSDGSDVRRAFQQAAAAALAK